MTCAHLVSSALKMLESHGAPQDCILSRADSESAEHLRPAADLYAANVGATVMLPALPLCSLLKSDVRLLPISSFLCVRGFFEALTGRCCFLHLSSSFPVYVSCLPFYLSRALSLPRSCTCPHPFALCMWVLACRFIFLSARNHLSHSLPLAGVIFCAR